VSETTDEIGPPRCETCVSEGERSKVYLPQYSITTAMIDPPPYYDEEGRFHRHVANTNTAEWTCSRGHRWTVRSRPACPAGDVPGLHEVTFTANPDPDPTQ